MTTNKYTHQIHKRAEDNGAETFCGLQVTGLSLDNMDNTTCENCRHAYYGKNRKQRRARAAIAKAENS